MRYTEKIRGKRWRRKMNEDEFCALVAFSCFAASGAVIIGMAIWG